MATKGASNRYGGSKARFSNTNTNGVTYQWAKIFNKNTLKNHFERHKKKFNFDSIKSYEQHAIRFANFVDYNNVDIYVDKNLTTYKFNNKTNGLAIISKKGYIITYYIVNDKFVYNKKGGTRECVHIKKK